MANLALNLSFLVLLSVCLFPVFVRFDVDLRELLIVIGRRVEAHGTRVLIVSLEHPQDFVHFVVAGKEDDASVDQLLQLA